LALLLASAFVLGVAYCAPPGVVNAESLRRGLAHGYLAALLLQLGSLIGDCTWAVLALAGAAYLVQSHVARLALGLVGAALLFWLAWRALRDALRDASRGRGPVGGQAPHRGHFATGALLSLTNPFAIPFWLGVGGSVVALGAAAPRLSDFATFFAGFLAGGLLWGIAFSALVAWGRRLITPSLFRWIDLACAVALAWFGLSLLLRTLG
jgi:chemosensory pili system protein ChpE